MKLYGEKNKTKKSNSSVTSKGPLEVSRPASYLSGAITSDDQGCCSFQELSPEPFKRLRSTTSQKLLPVLCHPPCEQIFPEALPEPLTPQFRAVAPCCIM